MVRAASPRRRSRGKPVVRVLLGDAIAMGPGKADLLDAIERTGSISAAARHLGMSYRRAWDLVDTMNRCFRAPVVNACAGGARGGGCTLTDAGRAMLARYRAMEQRAVEAIRGEMDEFEQLLKPRPSTAVVVPPTRGRKGRTAG